MKASILAFTIMLGVGFAVGYWYVNRDFLVMYMAGATVKDLKYDRVDESGVVLSFKTERPVASRVLYGTTTMYGVEQVGPSKATEHSYFINGLLPGKDHNFAIELKTEDGKVFLTDNYFVQKYSPQ